MVELYRRTIVGSEMIAGPMPNIESNSWAIVVSFKIVEPTTIVELTLELLWRPRQWWDQGDRRA